MMHVHDVAADLRTEQDTLDAIVGGLSAEQWRLATPSPGWTVADQIGHLTYYDGAAATAIDDPPAFKESMAELFADPGRIDDLTLHRHLSTPDLLETWRATRRRLAQAAATLDDDRRVEWYGPSMGAKSFLTARLMECWAHGQDVADAVGVRRQPTDRLRHIAQIGFITRNWSYANRGLQRPEGDVRLELTGPSGDVWSFGPDGAADVVRGAAEDFCLVVTQRRHADDTTLEVAGPLARDWLARAQAFAGPPTDGPAPGERPASGDPGSGAAQEATP
jgi:uncharacterized protein (TIGR03084 family)